MVAVRDKSKRDMRLISGDQPPKQEFNKIKIGRETLSNDVTLSTDFFNNNKQRRFDRRTIENAINNNKAEELRAISQYFFTTSGIYSRLCRYMAYLYRYDYFITPIVLDEKLKTDKIIEGWYKSAMYLDNCNLKKVFGEIALDVIKDGCYYGYILKQNNAAYLQQLPSDYCRSRYRHNGRDAIEFNVKYFDETFADIEYRKRVIKMFPKEIQKAYVGYKNGTLPIDMQSDERGWILLDPTLTVKFNLSGTDTPLFISVIPAILDLEDAKDLDKQKMQQQIMRIIIQKMPLDKNGDLVFDLDEVSELHKNAVAMIGKAIGVNVLTTFADVDVADMSDKGNVSSVDQLNKVERGVYNEAGVSQMQFNTETNLALEKSIANDEATMSDLLLQFQNFSEGLLSPYNKNPKRLYYKVQMLPTTIYNYKDLAKMYKEQTQLGFSKLLPQVAMGHSQLTVMSTAYFENELMNLDELFVPPQMSSTISKEQVANETEASGGELGGRPELEDDQKSDKTILNQESSN